MGPVLAFMIITWELPLICIKELDGDVLRSDIQCKNEERHQDVEMGHKAANRSTNSTNPSVVHPSWRSNRAASWKYMSDEWALV